MKPKLKFTDYIRRLQAWRNKYETALDARPRLMPLDALSHYLAEFHHNKFDEIEVPSDQEFAARRY